MSQMNEITISAGMRKMHYYAIFVLQKLVKDAKITMDFDPLALDISMVNEFNPDDFKQLLKKQKNNTKNITSTKPDIVKTIVTEYYNNSSRILTRPCTPRDEQDDESMSSGINSGAEGETIATDGEGLPEQSVTPTESTPENTVPTVVVDPVDELVLLVSGLAIKPKKKYNKKSLSGRVCVAEGGANTTDCKNNEAEGGVVIKKDEGEAGIICEGLPEQSVTPTESTPENTVPTVVVDPVDELVLLVSGLAIKPKRKYNRKVVSKVEPTVAAEPVAAEPDVVSVVPENQHVKEDKPKRKYKKNTLLDNETKEDNSIVSDIVNASRNPTVLDEPAKKTKKIKKTEKTTKPTTGRVSGAECRTIAAEEPVQVVVAEEPSPMVVEEEQVQVVVEEKPTSMVVEEDESNSGRVCVAEGGANTTDSKDLPEQSEKTTEPKAEPESFVENVTVNINYTVDDDSRISVVNVTAVNDDTGEIYINNKELEQEPYKEILKEKPSLLEEGEIDETEEEEEEEEDDATEIEAQIIIFENKQYLIDADNNIYDKDSFEEVGTRVNGVIKFISPKI